MTKRIFSLVLLLSLLMTGCSKTWVDRMVSEIETAYHDTKRMEDRTKATTLVAEKYFTPEMSGAEVAPLLYDLRAYGFRVVEERGKWSDGGFNPYTDRDIPQGVTRISMTKKYRRVNINVLRHLVISFVIKDADDRVSDVNAVLSFTSP